MMVQMAKAMESWREGNVAVACIAEPAFVSKSRVLKGEVGRLIRGRVGVSEQSSLPEVRLTFLLGGLSVFPRARRSFTDPMRLPHSQAGTP